MIASLLMRFKSTGIGFDDKGFTGLWQCVASVWQWFGSGWLTSINIVSE
ncbi:hypothetical protein Barb7_02563 [Bacteroidales bacterium Barb7]|nr:hypothetical protein Barb7_02563 [Bacteroidales bacterium Barb7]